MFKKISISYALESTTVFICTICFNIKNLSVLPTAYFCVSYDSQNKQRLLICEAGTEFIFKRNSCFKGLIKSKAKQYFHTLLAAYIKVEIN
jgi:hypothetical protein